MGIKSTFTQEIADEICSLLAAGYSLRAICRRDEMPPESTVRQWVIDDTQGFAAQYARARDMGLDTMADEVIEIADMPPGTTDNGGTDTGDVADKRLRFDARRWYLSKLAPKKYGDRLATELTGADGGPVQISDTERVAKIASIMALAQARKSGEAVDDLV